MLDEQMRAAGDPELQRLLKRIRLGVQDRTDLDLLNSRCYRESRRIPWESGITVVTPLNRNRWNLNMEASLAFQIQQRSVMRIFISEHKWKGGQPTEEEAIIMLKQGDDSAIPVPAVFMYVAGMAVVVNHNTHQGLKLVNGAGYRAVEVILDKAYPGHRVSADMTIHFGPPVGNTRVGNDGRVPLRRDATRHGLTDTHERSDPMPAETAVAAKRRHQKRAAMHGGLCMHGLQGAGGDARTSGAGVARHEDDGRQRSCRALAVRPLQPVRAAIAVPDARRHHARVKGTGREIWWGTGFRWR
ncbi:hypothetical protein HIM_11332 [Hirsutella minnesotensis 3608]|uniref:Uncharacterized protein n=1 Tax=Hirsutella minnesotensis 3608 TaxID=1043627 RepID=A0A0F7ZRA5_9HYPO|nr:hypothetical protein HIM_11332 [Hirsutella minnesotensis 3608]